MPDTTTPGRWRAVDVLRSTAIVTAYLIGLLLLWIARDIFLTAFIGVLFGLAFPAQWDPKLGIHVT